LKRLPFRLPRDIARVAFDGVNADRGVEVCAVTVALTRNATRDVSGTERSTNHSANDKRRSLPR